MLGFFGVSVIWNVYNAFVPIFLADLFLMAAGFIGFFMTLDNIAALFIQSVVGSWSDRLRTAVGRRMPFIIAGAPLAAISFILLPLAQSILLFFLAVTLLLFKYGGLAHSCCSAHAGYHALQIPLAGERHHQFYG